MFDSMKNSLNTQRDPVNILLMDLGLSANESTVYVSSLGLGNALVKDIAKKAKMNRTTTYNLLLGLRKNGFVSSYQKGGCIHFSPTPPQTLKDLLNERIRKEERLKATLDDLLPTMNAMFRTYARGSSTKLFEGLNSLPDIYRSVYQNAKHGSEGLEFTNWGGKYALFPEYLRKDLFAEFAYKGIWTRSLLVQDELTKRWAGDANVSTQQRKNIKLLPNPGWDFFCNLEIFENRFAIVTYRSDVEFQGLVIEGTELSSMFRLLFDSVWNAIPATPTSSPKRHAACLGVR